MKIIPNYLVNIIPKYIFKIMKIAPKLMKIIPNYILKIMKIAPKY